MRRLATGLLALGLALLVLTLLVGPEIKGATRWLPIGGLVIQPGEFVKPALVVVVAALLARAPGLANALPALLLVALVLLLLLSQPDVSMALMVATLFAVQLFVAGLPWLLVLGLGAVGVVALWQAYVFFPHVAQRFDRFLDPDSGDHYQVGLALEAVRGAAWFGSGPGEGRVKYALPDAHSDFVFAVIAEEFGVIACLAAARPVRLRPAARTAAHRGRGGPLRVPRGHRTDRSVRRAVDRQPRRQSQPAAGDRHDSAVHQLRRLLAVRAGARHGAVSGADQTPARARRWRCEPAGGPRCRRHRRAHVPGA